MSPNNAPARRSIMMQGVEVRDAIVDTEGLLFGRLSRHTRRGIAGAVNKNWGGIGTRDVINVPKVGILGDLYLTVTGEVVVAAASSVFPLWRWPYDLVRRFELSANGVTNLISLSGAKLKAYSMIAYNNATDRGISRTLAGSARTQGTLCTSDSETWPFGPNAAFSTAGTYTFQITYRIPVLFNEQKLIGAIFAQTNATNIEAAIQWATNADLFSTANSQVVPTIQNVKYSLEADTWTVPSGPDGSAVLPDLRQFHSVRQINDGPPANGESEYRISGQGPGKQLLRVFGQILTDTKANTAASVTPTPLAVNNTNYAEIAIRYGTADAPISYPGGTLLALDNERDYASAIGAYHGFWALDFCAKGNAYRDTIDEGSAPELRVVTNIPSGVSLVSPVLEYCVEEVVTGAVSG